jgi:chlorite dismutase
MVGGSLMDRPVNERPPGVRRYVHVLALRADSAWRRLPDADRERDAESFLEASRRAAERATTYTYSMVGTRADMDMLFWRLAASLEDLEETASLLLRSGLGRWCAVAYSMIGLVRPSNYVKQRTPQEEALFAGERSRYLIVYPFVKSPDWYLMPEEERRRQMSEHIRIGRGYPMVQQLLAYSFGLDDQEFIVAYETDDLPAFQDLVRVLRTTEGRRVTIRDTPQLVGVHRPLDEILDLLGR